jgi:hypothetical protein
MEQYVALDVSLKEISAREPSSSKAKPQLNRRRW